MGRGSKTDVHVHPLHGIVLAGALAISLIGLGPAASAAPSHVNCDTGGHLQTKINAADPGSTILVKGTCDGPFHITGKGLTLIGDPTATLDGKRAGSTLTVDAAGRAVHLSHLVITGGKSFEGGGIDATAEKLTLSATTVKGNRAVASNNPSGGGIYAASVAALSLVNSRVTGNTSVASPASGFTYAYGGGIYSGDVTLTRSVVSGNRAVSTSADDFAYVYGGGVYAVNVTLASSTIELNTATATGHNFAYAYGGGLSVSYPVIDHSKIHGNIATAQSETSFAYTYGAGIQTGGAASFKRSSVDGNRAKANGTDFAYAYGGGIDAGQDVTLVRSSVNGNRVLATSSGNFAESFGGGIHNNLSPMKLVASTIGRNVAKASGATDATASGGGIDSDGAVTAKNSTIADNTARADAGVGISDIGDASGGGMAGDTISATAVTVAGNQAVATGAGVSRTGGGLKANDITLRGSIVATNTAETGPDCKAGTTTSLGHNLIRRKRGCLPSPKTSDKVGVAPKLGRLQDNGGPTQTMAIALSSPARNAVPPAACAVGVDQRGVHRPQGPRCDIGAYERKVG